MIDGAVEVGAQPHPKESRGETKGPQEFQAMQQFVAAVQSKKNNTGVTWSRAKVEEIFNLDWVRKSAGHEDVQDPKDGWYRERIRTGGSSLRVHIQPEGLTAEKGDMMLGYTDMRGNQGDTAVEEVFELDSTIPGSPCRKVRLDFKAGKAYKFQIFIPPGENEDPGTEGEHIIRGISQESETGETIWSFE